MTSLRLRIWLGESHPVLRGPEDGDVDRILSCADEGMAGTTADCGRLRIGLHLRIPSRLCFRIAPAAIDTHHDDAVHMM